VTGAAAPVLVLAAAVSISDLADLTAQLRRRSSEMMHYLDAQESRLAENRPRDSKGPKNSQMEIIEMRFFGLGGLQRLVLWTGLVQAANMLVQAVLLGASLWALISQANEGPPLLWLGIAVLGVAILSAAGIVRTAVRHSRHLWEVEVGRGADKRVV
jgi:hypothetical protein